MHTELVERQRWIDESRFLHALNFAMLRAPSRAHQPDPHNPVNTMSLSLGSSSVTFLRLCSRAP